MTGIYKITSPSSRVYIGQSVDCEGRWKHYMTTGKKQTKLYRSFQKYGKDAHTFEVIEECAAKQLNNRERYWQDYYNVLEGGLNCRLQHSEGKSGKMSKESLEKRSNTKRKLGQVPPSWKGKKQSKGHIKKRINSRPENIGKLISKGKKGKSNGLEGRVYSEHEKEKLYKSRRKKVLHIPTNTVYCSVMEAVNSPNGSYWKVTGHLAGKVENSEWKYL